MVQSRQSSAELPGRLQLEHQDSEPRIKMPVNDEAGSGKQEASITMAMTAPIHPEPWASIRKEIARCVQAEIGARAEKSNTVILVPESMERRVER